MTNNNRNQSDNYWNYPKFNYNFYNTHRKISLEEAICIAQERLPGKILKAEIDNENGLRVYEIVISTKQDIEYELEIDIYTGQIIKLKSY